MLFCHAQFVSVALQTSFKHNHFWQFNSISKTQPRLLFCVTILSSLLTHDTATIPFHSCCDFATSLVRFVILQYLILNGLRMVHAFAILITQKLHKFCNIFSISLILVGCVQILKFNILCIAVQR